MDDLYRRYKDKGVEFIILYQREAHPMIDDETEQPTTYEGRLDNAQKFCKMHKAARPVAIDKMDDNVRRKYGRLPNSAFVIAKDGKVALKQAWANPAEIEETLSGLLGNGAASAVAQDDHDADEDND